MKKVIEIYLDNCFSARSLPTIAWGAFFPHLKACILADGGTWDELHQNFELPPAITKSGYEIISGDEIFRSWWSKK